MALLSASEDVFNMDFRFPFSPFQAFAICWRAQLWVGVCSLVSDFSSAPSHYSFWRFEHSLKKSNSIAPIPDCESLLWTKARLSMEIPNLPFQQLIVQPFSPSTPRNGTLRAAWDLRARSQFVRLQAVLRVRPLHEPQGPKQRMFQCAFKMSAGGWFGTWLLWLSTYWEESSQLTNSYFSGGWNHQPVNMINHWEFQP